MAETAVQLNDMYKQMVYNKYFQICVCPEIKQIRKNKQRKIIDYINCIRLQDNAKNVLSNEEKEIISDLTEIGDVKKIFKIMTDIKLGNSMCYIFDSIQYSLEKYFCLSLNQRDEFIKNAQNYKDCDNFRNPLISYFSKQYNYIVDAHELHSGASYGYCIRNLYKFATSNVEEKTDHWCKLIESYILNKM